jgi:hypothetical protein
MDITGIRPKFHWERGIGSLLWLGRKLKRPTDSEATVGRHKSAIPRATDIRAHRPHLVAGGRCVAPGGSIAGRVVGDRRVRAVLDQFPVGGTHVARVRAVDFLRRHLVGRVVAVGDRAEGRSRAVALEDLGTGYINVPNPSVRNCFVDKPGRTTGPRAKVPTRMPL